MKLTTAIGTLALLASFGAAPLIAQTSNPSQSTGQMQPSDQQGTSNSGASQSQSTTGDSNTTPSSASAAPKAWYGDLKADALIGKKLVDSTGRKVGEIDDIAMQNQSQSLHAVVGVGGFIGIGEKKVAIPLTEIQQHSGSEEGYATRHTEDELKAMPEFSENQYRSIDRNRTLASVRE